MKTKIILPALFALGAAFTSTQAIATGMTYDPYANYYGTYYGIDASPTVSLVEIDEELQQFYDPYAIFYNTYYGTDDLIQQGDKTAKTKPTKISTIQITDEVIMDEMSDPTNFYKW